MAKKPRNRVVLDTGSESRTKQSFKDQCDINNIMKKYIKTGTITHIRNSNGKYGDFTSAMDYHDAMNAVHEANEAFMGLSAAVRSRFDNDPGKLLDFVNDAKNKDEAIKLGLIEKPPHVPVAIPVEAPPK